MSSMAQGESAVKSTYAKANWSKRRALSAANPGQFVFTKECPNWLEVREDRYMVNEPIAEAVRKVHELYAQGWGLARLCRYANENSLPAPGRSNSWHYSLILRVLDNPAVIGEFQPCNRVKGKRIPTGNVIEGFYPAIVPLPLWHKVRKLREQSPTFPGKRELNNYNYLQGLAFCACGGAWRRMNKNSQTQNNYSLYGCSNRQRAFTKCANINGLFFDFFFISRIYQQIPLLLKGDQNPELEKIAGLAAQLEEVRRKKKRLLDLLQVDEAAAQDVAPLLAQRREEEAQLTRQITELRKLETPAEIAPYPDPFIFLYAFSYHPEKTQYPTFYEDAYRARSYFRVRLLEILRKATISADRKGITLMFKNGQELEMPIVDLLPDLLPVDHLKREGAGQTVANHVALINSFI
jgi:hypothetical protein